MKIDRYSFGSMTVEGKTYKNDLIVFPEKVEPEWWREEGHSLSLNDLKDVLDYKPDYLIIGRGAQSQMRIPSNIECAIKGKGIEILSGGTKEMYRLFNRYMDEHKKAIGAFHLTC